MKKKEIIETLLKFDRINYHRLYLFLAFDQRVKPFQCYAQYIDGVITLKNMDFPNWLYNMLCNNEVKPWNVSDELLFQIINYDL